MKLENTGNLYHLPKMADTGHARGHSTGGAKIFQLPTSTAADAGALSTAQATGKSAAAAGVPRAMERLQHNLEKNPGNPGLENALERLQRNALRHSIVPETEPQVEPLAEQQDESQSSTGQV